MTKSWLCEDGVMAAFHVFIDGAVDSSAAGVERLAQAIAGHYGLPITDLQARIASGRFRVKGNCDRATADRYVNDLSRLGAVCSIEEATPANHSKTPLPFPAVTAPTKPPLAAQLAPKPAARPVASPSVSPSGANYQSGLSAAFATSDAEAHLGALESEAFTLAALDGGDDVPAPPAPSFAPPEPHSVAVAAAAESKAPPREQPIDMFAPPDEAEHSLSVDLAPEEAERAARKRQSAPPENAVETPPVKEYTRPSLPPPEAARYSRPSLVAPNAPVAARASHPLANENLRFVLGVVVAILIGFLPAHIVASVRLKSEFAAVNARVETTQKQATTAEAYAALDSFRAEQLARKYDERQTIAMMALVIWGLAGGGVAYVWFRRIPWPAAG